MQDDAAMVRHHHHGHHRHGPLYPGAWPGVLGMQLGGPVYWRPGVPRLPDVVYDVVGLDDEVIQRGDKVRARY